ncbi:Auxin transport protein BIG [Platanthera guangdongensis]|uniref:Auxin transport protein BIG n=1 Tax=Platanthera guangdongensis TaxID=2320717 RepID=A0ABR2LWY1_9ASPA
MSASSSPTNFVGLSRVRIMVVGDVGTGKSSLIVAATTESFLENVPSVLPPHPPPCGLLSRSSTPHHHRYIIQVKVPVIVVGLSYTVSFTEVPAICVYLRPNMTNLARLSCIESVAASIDCDATSGDEDDDDGTSDGDMSSLDKYEEDDSNSMVADFSSLDQSKRVRIGGEYAPSSFTSSPFHPQPTPLWPGSGYMAPPVLYCPYGGYLVPQVALPSPTPVLAPSVYAFVQVIPITQSWVHD